MQILAGWTRVVAVGLVGASLSAAVGRPQHAGSAGQQPSMGQQAPTTPDPKDPFGQNQPGKSKADDSPFGNGAEKQAIMRNDERQKRLVTDSDKLLQLATELHVEDELYRTAAGHFGEKGLVDMVVLAGCYHMVCSLLNAFAVPAPRAAESSSE